MAFNYLALRDQASKVINTFGQSAVLRHRVEVVDPVTGVSVPTISDTAVRVVVAEAKNNPNDPNLPFAEKQILMGVTEGQVVDPTRHRIVVGTTIYRIVSGTDVSPGGINVLWDLRASRGE